MKKRAILMSIFSLMAVLFFGCGKTTADYVKENVAEITKTFYFAENENFYITLASGQREKEYLLDGRAQPLTDFALLSVTFFDDIPSEIINVEVTIDEEKRQVEMEYNSMTNSFLADLELLLNENEQIAVKYADQTLTLENLSKNFVIDWQQALNIAIKELKTEIEKEKKYANLNAEVYLKVLDKKANKFDNFFWCFTILNVKNESFSVIISTTDGSVLAKTK